MESKIIFNTEDFNKLNWHDCKIYGMAFDDVTYKFYLDIDFILEWIEPINDEDVYKFKIAPATLIFNNVWDVVFDIETNLALDIDNITKLNPHTPKNIDILPEVFEYDWHIELQQGEISFKSIGFELFIRKQPAIMQMQYLGLSERGGISFDTK